MGNLDRWNLVLLGGWAISVMMVVLSEWIVPEGVVSKTFTFWMAFTGGCFAGRNLLNRTLER